MTRNEKRGGQAYERQLLLAIEQVKPPGKLRLKMTEGKETKYYRIEQEGTRWAPGTLLSFGEQPNKFTLNWRAEESKINVPQRHSEAYINELMCEIYNTIREPEAKNKTIGEIGGLLRYLEKTLKGHNDAIVASRELAFELVRRDHFPMQPSRMNCIFLIPADNNSVSFWWHQLKSQGLGSRRIFQVSAIGESHRVSQSLLGSLQSCSINEWERRALSYWGQQDSVKKDDEVLFVGELKVAKEHTIADFGLSMS